MKFFVVTIFHLVMGIIVLPIAGVIALVRRYSKFQTQPAILFGMEPLINNKYWAQALRKRGYRSFSYAAYTPRVLYTKQDFDYLPDTLFPWLPGHQIFRLVKYYLCFLWGFTKFDVFVFDFAGGFLRSTPWRYIEFPLYAFARRKLIAIPFGGDVQDLRRCRDAITQAVILQDYPSFGVNYPEIERRVAHYTRWASFIICGGAMIDYLPRFDLLVTNALAVDTDIWQSVNAPLSTASPANQPIKILHAPNHRHIKGTDFLVRACQELQAEGVPVELVLRERIPNDEIRRLMEQVDIIASAFVMGYYELFAIEGMSMSRPVLNYWRPDLKFIYSTYSYAAECPIVDTPLAQIKENLRRLVEQPSLRASLGEAGRRYVDAYHSYEAVGCLFEKIMRKVWFAEEVSFFPFTPAPSEDIVFIKK